MTGEQQGAGWVDVEAARDVRQAELSGTPVVREAGVREVSDPDP